MNLVEQHADLIIGRLNEMLEADPEAISNLMSHRTPCNEVLAAHPTVQVGTMAGTPRVGLLGLLNGLVGVIQDGPKKNYGLITAIVEEGRVLRFERTRET